MSPFIETLKRMYNAEPQKITIEKLDNLKAEGKITIKEYDYITA